MLQRFLPCRKTGSYGTNLHLEETGFKEGNSAASSIVLGITRTVLGLAGRTHGDSTSSQCKRRHVCG